MKKLLLIFLFFTLLTCGCSKEQERKQEIKSATSENDGETRNNAATNEALETEVGLETIIDKDVEIVMGMMNLDGETTIETYVAGLNESNEEEYYVYDESHYAIVIKESERQETLNKITSKDAELELISSLNKNYPNVFKKMLYDSDKQEVLIYVDDALYQEADFGVVLTSIITGLAYAEAVQAYNLVPIEKRNTVVLIIDEATEKTIYSSDEE